MGGSIARALFIASLGSGFVIGTMHMPMLWFRAMTDIGMAMVPVVACIVVGQILLIFKLQASQSEPVRFVGHALSVVTQYLALFEGLIFFVPILWITAITFGYGTPPTADTFMGDLVIGTAYAAIFIYAGTGGAAIVGVQGRLKQFLAVAYTVLAIGIPVAFLQTDYGQIDLIGIEYPISVIATCLCYLALASVLGMLLIEGPASRPLTDDRNSGRG